MEILTFLAGGALLFLGADVLVRGGANLARRFGISEVAIGLTVVAYGTSLPEVMVTSSASLAGTPGVAIGNVFGSNICNIALILGTAALWRPMAIHNQVVRREVPLLLLVSGVVVGFLINGDVARWEGLALLAAGLAFTYGLYRRAVAGAYNVADELPPARLDRSPWIDGALVVGGCIALYFGGEWFVAGAVEMARILGLSEQVIGLTMVAFGTSVPELVTVMMCLYRKEYDIGIGNLVGSNFFNLTIVLGTAATVAPVPFEGGRGWFDVAFALLLPLVFLPLLSGARVVGRLRGSVLLGGYAAYMAVLILVP